MLQSLDQVQDYWNKFSKLYSVELEPVLFSNCACSKSHAKGGREQKHNRKSDVELENSLCFY